MERQSITTVAVRPAAALAARPRLFAALADALGVRFVADGAADGVLAFGGGGLDGVSVPALAVCGDGVHEQGAEDLQLCATDGVDRRLHGVVLAAHGAAPPLDGPGQVLARSRAGVRWVREGQVQRVAATLTELGPQQTLRDALGLGLVAVVQFLRSLTGRGDPEPVRATILFDDPNLRWRSYGFIDYERLADHADAHGYHAGMAMIPLDTWLPNAATAALFRRRAERLSLVLHGNDHVSRELLRTAEPGAALALAAQALRRVERFEARTGVPVGRVMTPPHGMCSEGMVRALGALGYDALCAIHPLPWTEHPPPDRPLAGWDPADFAGGCAVIPRVPLPEPAAALALRAFLGHPIVLYGHHGDVAGGLEPLADAAARVARLGDVRWMSLGDIAAGNHALRVDGDTAVVTAYARRLRVDVPAGVRRLTVAAPRGAGDALTGFSAGGGGPVAFGAFAAVAGDTVAELRLTGAVATDPSAVAPPAWRPWPVLRRLATETRDRAQPLLAR